MKKTMAEHKVKLLISSLVILLPAVVDWQLLWECAGLLAAHWICVLLVFADRRNREGQSKKAVGLLFWLMPVTSLLLAAIRMAVQQGEAGIRITYLITCFAFGLLFLAVGNYMPKIRQNRTMGVRVKWTLASEANWNATHRFAGKVWVAAGLLCMISALLPLEMKTFTEAYFKTLCGRFPQFNPQDVIKAVWAGTGAMVKNDGSRTNREAFAAVFSQALGVDYYDQEPEFLDYYAKEFQRCVDVCRPSELSRKIVTTLQNKGYTVAVATNPIFPEIATASRLRWAGLEGVTFPLVTTFETSTYAKPNPEYYRQVCGRLGVQPSDCIMIGNDVLEDGVAQSLGMEVLLIADCLVNDKQLPTEGFSMGSLEDLLAWAEALPSA